MLNGNSGNFGEGLSESAQNVVYNVLLAVTRLNKRLARDPDNILKYKKMYDKEIYSIAKRFDKEWKHWADKDLAKAYLFGLKDAEKEIKKFGLKDISKNIVNGSFLIESPPPAPIPEIPGQTLLWFEGYESHPTFFGVFRNAAYYSLEEQRFQIIRKANDIYRESAILAAEKTFQESDYFTRIRFSQAMLDDLAKKGLQTITYKNGAKYSLDTYCEMAGRSLSNRATLQSRLNRYNQSGYNLVIVSSHFRACNLCTPYEGKTLSIEPHPVYESVADAETQGLFHSNCKHNISVWFEGMEKSQPSLATGEQKLVDEYGYKEAQKISYAAQVKQRQIERNIRNWKRRSIVGLDKNTKNFADKKVRYWQYRQREHLKENTFLPRKYSREQIGKAH
jgi:hypothetical protein